MSYRNPQIIVDRSAEIYAQAVGQMGQIWAQGIAGYFENKNKIAAAKKKKDDAYKLGLNGIALKEDERLADKTSKIQGSTLYEDIQNQARIKLDGSEDQIGIIEKKAQLKLNPDLSPELSKQYRKDIANYQKWENNIVDKVSSTMADLEPIKDLTATTIGVPGKQDFIGEGNEKFSNFVVAYALDGKQVPGIESTRGVEGDLIKFNINIDPKDEFIKKFIENGALNIEDLKLTEDGKYQLDWERNLNNWNGGLIADVADSMDIQSSLENGGLVKDGVITREFTTGIDYEVKPIGNTGYQRVTEKIFFNPNLIIDNPTVKADFKKHAAGVLAPGTSLDEQMLDLRNNFNYEGSRKDWQSKTPEEQEEYIITELEEQAIQQAMQGDKDFKVKFDEKAGKWFTYGKTTERKIPDSKSGVDETTKADIGYIEKIKIPIQEGPALESGKRPVDLIALENDVLNKQGFQVVKAEAVGGVDKIVITKSIAGTDNKAVITEDMTPQDIKRQIELVETGKLPAEKEGEEDFSLYKINE